jgi:hypothetical protein
MVGGKRGVLTRAAGTIGDDRGLLIGQELRGEKVDLVEWHVQGAGNVCLGIILGWQGLNESESGLGIVDLREEFVAADVGEPSRFAP